MIQEVNEMSVSERVFEIVSKSFGMKASDLTESTNLLEDLNAKSTNYFPIMNELEEEYDLELQYQTFRSGCRTIKEIISMVEESI